jgi:hypothetical protein
MIKRRYLATVVVSMGVLGKLDAAGAYPENTPSGSPSIAAGPQALNGSIGPLTSDTSSSQPPPNMADGDDNGDDNGDDGHHHRKHHKKHGDDGDDDGDD